MGKEFGESAVSSPERIPNAYRELLIGYTLSLTEIVKPTLLLNPEDGYSGTVTVADIPFSSICAHHFLPFYGTVTVSYRPGKMILGIGKIPRLVELRSKRFQIQEWIAKELAEDFMTEVGSLGVEVWIAAIHHCMCARGPKSGSARTIVTYKLGTLDDVI